MKEDFRNLGKRPMEICSVQGKPYIFSCLRIDRNTIPEDMYAYDMRDDCDGECWEICRHVLVNHWATIVGLEEIDLDENGRYCCKPLPEDESISSEGWFISEAVESVEEYRERYEELAELAKN